MSNKNSHKFAHAAEESFAQILNFYAIEWQYEPRTFPLEWDGDGNVTMAFTPDFYLPQQNLFVELTTLRPSLATIKNRKLRLMAELYPDVHIKLLKRRELHDLMLRFGLTSQAAQIRGSQSQQPRSISQSQSYE